MKVCVHRGLVIAVLTRNEHCPPHVHVGAADWDARFEFSFWHHSVRLWDVLPAQNAPTAQLLEEVRHVLKQPAHLKRARQLWWVSRQTLCLHNQQWDPSAAAVVSPRLKRANALDIQGGHFDSASNRTVLSLAGRDRPLEIQL
jgi:hypothetical protein